MSYIVDVLMQKGHGLPLFMSNKNKVFEAVAICESFRAAGAALSTSHRPPKLLRIYSKHPFCNLHTRIRAYLSGM